MGILVAPDLILTCGHVVNLAAGRDRADATSLPDDTTVTVIFPFVSNDPHPAKVETWTPPGRDKPDVSVLRLVGPPAPTEAGLAILSDPPLEAEPGTKATITQIRTARDAGHYAEVSILPNLRAWKEMRLQDQPLPEGDSGAAVYDPLCRGVVGMAVASNINPDLAASYMIPVGVVRQHARALPVEDRQIGASWLRLWQVLAVLSLIVSFGFMIETQGTAQTSFLSFWTYGQNALAALFGAHLLAIFLLPLQFVIQARHVRSFRFRPWYQRVPPLMGSTAWRGLFQTPLLAGLKLVFFCLLPLYALGSFLDEIVLKPRTVVVYESDVLEYGVSGATCGQGHEGVMCVHPQATLWTAIPDYPYWDNAYHLIGESGWGAVIWPRLTPWGLIIFALITSLLLVCVLWRTFRPLSRG